MIGTNAITVASDLDVAGARLPAMYQNAKHALSECSRIDECQAWADKAEALASYARQARDNGLHKLADRIQARAIRRAGELLQMIEPQQGGDRRSTGRHSPVDTRTQAATDAGLSERQRKTALRVAAIDGEAFEAQVESDAPPTITELAEQGTKKRLVDLGDISPADYARATEAIGTLRRFSEFCTKHDARTIAASIKPHEAKSMRECVGVVDVWLDAFVVNLSGGD